MWTPRRVVLLSLGLALFVFSYGVYIHFLGGIDGLPTLPDQYSYSKNRLGDGGLPPPPIQPANYVDDQLRMAFGEECIELKYPIKLGVRSRGMFLAAKEFRILEDGRVRLSPISVALFGKNTPEGKCPEINTLRCNVAHLTFDRPIKNPTDMSKSRIVGAELIGNVDVVNNRKTAQRGDELTLFTQGPVYYDEAKSQIWTAAAVEIKDLQNRPDPNQIRANGMELHLTQTPQAKPGKQKTTAPPPPKKTGPGAFAGVEVIVLRSDVEMHLYVDADSGFLGSGKEAPPPTKDSVKAAVKEPVEPPKKSHVVIKTQGPFNYNVEKNHAQFDISQDPSPFPNRVAVHRFHEESKLDQLDCERLQLQFVNRDPDDPTSRTGTEADDRSLNLEIEHAHATGKEVTLLSDAEILEAHGNDFFHDAKKRISILKGEPEMWALKEGNEIHARELHLMEPKPGVHTAIALGPGRIELLDKATGKRPLKAHWTEKLETSKDGEFDLLVFTRDAAFQDSERDQSLQGDVLKVWLEPPEVKDPKNAPLPDVKNASPTQGRRPHHVEAIGNVVAKAPDLHVHDTDRLMLWFRDAKPGEALPGSEDRKREEQKKPAVAVAPPTPEPEPAVPIPPPPPSAAPMTPVVVATDEPAKPAGAPVEKKQRPMDLTAKLVQANVIRGPDGQYELERLWTEGSVHVLQAPASPEDKGVDISGKTLKVTRLPNGNVLVVTDDEDLARLRMDKIYIEGPTVTIDQTTNKAWVDGHGRMEMESNSNFQGDKLNKTVPVNVYWQKTMYFDGQFAEFHGGVQAQQEQALLLCQTMQVFLDREVSLKEGDRGGPPAKMRKLIADQGVRVDDKLYENGVLIKRQQIECPELSVDNEQGEMHASGPGIVRILQRGAADPTAPPPARPAAGKKSAEDEILKLTRVLYSGRMYGNNKTRTAIFTQDVDVVHLPSEDIKLEPNIDQLPLGGLYVRCDRLEVYSQKDEEKTNQQMKAIGRAYTQSLDRTGKVTGRASAITWNEQKQQVIFEGGGNGGLATLYREKVKGGPREEMKGTKILYWRNTGEMQGVEVKEVKTSN